MKHALLIIGLLLLAGCPPNPAPDPKPSPTPSPSPAPEATCAAACARAAELGCSWAQPTPNGASCVDVCENANEWEPWNLACRARASSCNNADVCETETP